MIVADFERLNFSVWPAKWEQGAKPDIVPIHAIGYTGSSDLDSPSTSSTLSQAGVSTNPLPIALGIGLGLGLPILTLIAFLVFARSRRRWPFDKSKKNSASDPDFPGGGPGEMSMNRGSADKNRTIVHEAAPADTPRPELAGVFGKHQPIVDEGELPASPAPFNSGKPRELSGSTASCELPGVTGPIELSATAADYMYPRESDILGELPSETVHPGYLSVRTSTATSRTPSLTSTLASPRDNEHRPMPPLPPYPDTAGPSPTSPPSAATGSSGTSARSTTRSELERSFQATRDARARSRKVSEGARITNDGGWI